MSEAWKIALVFVLGIPACLAVALGAAQIVFFIWSP